jgi:hypothetical protein
MARDWRVSGKRGFALRATGTHDVRKKIEIEAWFYALLLFNSAALAVRLVGRAASWFE